MAMQGSTMDAISSDRRRFYQKGRMSVQHVAEALMRTG